MGSIVSDRPHGKHVSIDSTSPHALGICDYSGFVFRRIDLVRQMEWRGNALVWTGYLVGRPYVDKPNEQLRPPILPPDPVPVLWPRLQQPTAVYWANQNIPWEDLPVYDWVSWSGSDDGIPAAPEDERLEALEIEQSPTTTYGNGGAPGVQQQTQAEILASLQNFHWGS